MRAAVPVHRAKRERSLRVQEPKAEHARAAKGPRNPHSSNLQSLKLSALNQALSSIAQGLIVVNRQELVQYANVRFGELLSIRAGTIVIGKNLKDILRRHAEVTGSKRVFEGIYARHHTARSRVVIKIPGTTPPRTVAITQQPLPEGGWVGTVEDITDRRNLQHLRESQAQCDSLTELPNRSSFFRHMQKEITRMPHGSKMALLCVDLDSFRFINETHGNAFGDELLKVAVQRLRGCVRNSDMLARMGGDEFAVLQTGIRRAKDAEVLSSRIVDVLSQPYSMDTFGVEAQIGAKVGIAMAPKDGTDADVLYKHSSLALYHAKSVRHISYSLFEPGLDSDLVRRHAMVEDLRHALRRDEFRVHYQGLYNLHNRKLVGYEALLRWQHPVHGLVMPDKFIPVAEESGLIGAIGDWVIHIALAQAAKWPKEIKIAINLSPSQIRNAKIGRLIKDALRASGVSADRLELEITESTFLQNSAATVGMLRKLKQLGLHIVLDDFGVGYSSLSYLRDYPFDKLKIDRSFVCDLPRSHQSKLLVRAIVSLGKSFGMTVTAEGVEKPAQLKYLLDAGCNQAQGYYFDKPQTAEVVLRAMHTRSTSVRTKRT